MVRRSFGQSRAQAAAATRSATAPSLQTGSCTSTCGSALSGSMRKARTGRLRVTRKRPVLALRMLPDNALPHVLVQLPVCNEGAVALRVAAAACALDWPKDRLTIQLLDDGNAENHAVLAQG